MSILFSKKCSVFLQTLLVVRNKILRGAKTPLSMRFEDLDYSEYGIWKLFDYFNLCKFLLGNVTSFSVFQNYFRSKTDIVPVKSCCFCADT